MKWVVVVVTGDGLVRGTKAYMRVVTCLTVAFPEPLDFILTKQGKEIEVRYDKTVEEMLVPQEGEGWLEWVGLVACMRGGLSMLSSSDPFVSNYTTPQPCEQRTVHRLRVTGFLTPVHVMKWLDACKQHAQHRGWMAVHVHGQMIRGLPMDNIPKADRDYVPEVYRTIMIGQDGTLKAFMH
jgi:hypothetical protein